MKRNSEWSQVDKVIRKRCKVNPRIPSRLLKGSRPLGVYFYQEMYSSMYYNLIECTDRWQLFFGGPFGLIEVRGERYDRHK